jgi:hypothetical protein
LQVRNIAQSERSTTDPRHERAARAGGEPSFRLPVTTLPQPDETT